MHACPSQHLAHLNWSVADMARVFACWELLATVPSTRLIFREREFGCRCFGQESTWRSCIWGRHATGCLWKNKQYPENDSIDPKEVRFYRPKKVQFFRPKEVEDYFGRKRWAILSTERGREREKMHSDVREGPSWRLARYTQSDCCTTATAVARSLRVHSERKGDVVFGQGGGVLATFDRCRDRVSLATGVSLRSCTFDPATNSRWVVRERGMVQYRQFFHSGNPHSSPLRSPIPYELDQVGQRSLAFPAPLVVGGSQALSGLLCLLCGSGNIS